MKLHLSAAALVLFASCSLHAALSPVLTPANEVPKLNLNKAAVEDLTQSVKGIGKKRAEAIVQYRTLHGKFTSLDELSQVKGLGPNFVKSHLAELEHHFNID